MNIRNLAVIIVVLMVMLLVVNFGARFIGGFTDLHSLIIFAIGIPLLVYFFYRMNRELDVARKILDSNQDLHEMYENAHRYNPSENGIIDLLTNLQEIEREFKEEFENEEPGFNKIIQYLVPDRQKGDKNITLILHPRVLTLSHDLAQKMIEAFAKDYR